MIWKRAVFTISFEPDRGRSHTLFSPDPLTGLISPFGNPSEWSVSLIILQPIYTTFPAKCTSPWRDPSDWTGLNCSSASFGWFFLLGFLVALSIESEQQ